HPSSHRYRRRDPWNDLGHCSLVTFRRTMRREGVASRSVFRQVGGWIGIVGDTLFGVNCPRHGWRGQSMAYTLSIDLSLDLVGFWGSPIRSLTGVLSVPPASAPASATSTGGSFSPFLPAACRPRRMRRASCT